MTMVANPRDHYTQTDGTGRKTTSELENNKTANLVENKCARTANKVPTIIKTR